MNWRNYLILFICFLLYLSLSCGGGGDTNPGREFYKGAVSPAWSSDGKYIICQKLERTISKMNKTVERNKAEQSVINIRNPESSTADEQQDDWAVYKIVEDKIQEDKNYLTKIKEDKRGNLIFYVPELRSDEIVLVVFSYYRSNYELYRMNNDGTNILQLTSTNTVYDKDLDNTVYDGEPICSPDGKYIAFESRRKGNSDIWLMDIEGKNLQQITFDPNEDTAPTFSPDSKKIIFASDRNKANDLWSITIGDTIANLFFHDIAWKRNPSWSPDGKWIAFDSNKDGRQQIYVIAPNDTLAHRITNYKNLSCFDPFWSPEGDKLCFFKQSEHFTILLYTTLDEKKKIRIL